MIGLVFRNVLVNPNGTQNLFRISVPVGCTSTVRYLLADDATSIGSPFGGLPGCSAVVQGAALKLAGART